MSRAEFSLLLAAIYVAPQFPLWLALTLAALAATYALYLSWVGK